MKAKKYSFLIVRKRKRRIQCREPERVDHVPLISGEIATTLIKGYKLRG